MRDVEPFDALAAVENATPEQLAGLLDIEETMRKIAALDAEEARIRAEMRRIATLITIGTLYAILPGIQETK